MTRLARLLLLALALLAPMRARAQRDAGFPHDRHARVFPTCVGCHRGIVTGDSAAAFPDSASCTRCHDGQQEQRVSWSGPRPHPTNLAFSHPVHAEKTHAGTSTEVCLSCHGVNGSTQWMNIAGARPSACLACHAHEAAQHLAPEAQCATCHVPVARAAGLSVERIAAFPRPPTHEAKNFVSDHAPRDAAALQRCATCHTQESCARCHVNAATLPAITALSSDVRVAQVVSGKRAEYPEPRSHRAHDFIAAHGTQAEHDVQRCANCHAQASCNSCHLGGGGRSEITKLPLSGAAPGVQLRAADPDWTLSTVASGGEGEPRPQRVRAHPRGFIDAHGAEAADRNTCLSCHQQRFCANCHAGEGQRTFHPRDFIQGHVAEAYGRERDCASCHNTEVFCKSCHKNVGIASKGRLTAAFHTGQPNWLLQHGQAARQGLESCASCHQQNDCLRCHATTGFNINPHGPGFDAEQMARKNKLICFKCHITDPLAH